MNLPFSCALSRGRFYLSLEEEHRAEGIRRRGAADAPPRSIGQEKVIISGARKPWSLADLLMAAMQAGQLAT